MGILVRDVLGIGEGVLLEAGGDDEKIAIWVRLERDRRFEYWDRIVARLRDERIATGGVRWAPATAVRTKRRSTYGRIGGLFAKLAGRPSDASWIMPDGTAAERFGDRRADLALAWADEQLGTLDEGRLTGLWRGEVRLLRLGSRLFLAVGVEAGAAANRDDVADAEGSATRLLASARAAGDRRAEAAALADLAMSWAKNGRSEAALGPLHEALALYRTLDDRGGEADVLVDLGRVLEDLGRPHESQRALDAAAALTGGLDAFTQKAVLERLADALERRGDPAGAVLVLGRAVESARAAGDRRHEARLLWLEAAAWADAGRSDLSLERATESTALLRSESAVEADWYDAQLRRYRSSTLTSASKIGPNDGSVAPIPTATSMNAASDPGIFRMAMSATRAMATFLGSGMRTTTVEKRRARLEACRACAHHTGLRCRICGCFTNAKATLPHEQCPVGRW